jgi:hypothetical protein
MGETVMVLTQTAVVALGAMMLFIGVREAIAPRAAARGYGVPLDADRPPTPYHSGKANRDIALGMLLVLIAFTSSPAGIAAMLVAAALCPVWDGLLVLRLGRRRDTIIHFATAAYLLAAAGLALAGR